MQESKATATYFFSRQLKTLVNADGLNALVEQHTLDYLSGGVYMNGNKASDVFQLKGPVSSAPCWAATCTASWGYDARDRLVFEDAGTGDTGPAGSVNLMTLDTIGNVTFDSGSNQTRVYSGQRLVSDGTSKYIYDGFGRLSREIVAAATTNTRGYWYGGFAERLTINDTTAGRLNYVYDPHGSVSLLLDQANVVKKSYGYAGYGGSIGSVTKNAAGFTDPNRYQYTAKRWDAATSTYDIGLRCYTPGSSRWLQSDLYYDALDNLGLTADPMLANRYLFTGANPVNFVELDGHRFCLDDDCRGPSGPAAPGGVDNSATGDSPARSSAGLGRGVTGTQSGGDPPSDRPEDGKVASDIRVRDCDEDEEEEESPEYVPKPGSKAKVCTARIGPLVIVLPCTG